MQIVSISLISQMITFGLFIWFTMRFIWPKVTVVLDERRKTIADGIAAADKAEKDLEVAQFKAKEIVSEAKAQASVIIEKANQRSHRIHEDALEEGRQMMDKMRKSAKDEIAQHAIEVRSSLQSEVATIALSATEKLLERNIDKATNQSILDQFIKDIKVETINES